MPHPSTSTGTGTGTASTATATTATPTRRQPALAGVRQQQPYPNFKVVVLNDDVNTFQHVVECLVKYLPGMGSERAWELAHQIDRSDSAVVWCGPQEQAELYHQQLGGEGLTMAPLEQA